MAVANSSFLSADISVASVCIQFSIGSIGNVKPITPVEATITSSFLIFSSFAASSHIFSAFSTPSALQVFAFFEFTIIAWEILFVFCKLLFVTIIGAPFTLF